MKSPVLFLIFNRPDTTQRVFDVIREYKPSKLYIAADGPRQNISEDATLCNQVKSIVAHIDWDCECVRLYRDKNLGCGVAVSQAISWFFEHETEGIILEDDCLPTIDFFNFCNVMLDTFRDNLRVFNISGFSPINIDTHSLSYYASLFPGIWGWATWKRSWNTYDFKLTHWSTTHHLPQLEERISNTRHRAWLQRSFDAVVQGTVDTWDFQFTYALIQSGAVSIHPIHSLIQNIGLTHHHATHTNRDYTFASSPQRSIFPIIHAPENELNPIYDDQIFDIYFNTRITLTKIIRKLKKILCRSFV